MVQGRQVLNIYYDCGGGVRVQIGGDYYGDSGGVGV